MKNIFSVINMIGEKCDNLIGYIMTSEEIENQNISNIILDIVISFIILLNLCLINLSTLYYLYSQVIEPKRRIPSVNIREATIEFENNRFRIIRKRLLH